MGHNTVTGSSGERASQASTGTPTNRREPNVLSEPRSGAQTDEGWSYKVRTLASPLRQSWYIIVLTKELF